MFIYYFQSSYQTFSDTFRDLLPNNMTLFQRSSSTDIFRKLLANNTYHTLFQSLYQTILAFSESYFHIIIQQKHFSGFVLHNIDTFRELLPNNIDLECIPYRAHTKQYSHFHRVITKQ